LTPQRGLELIPGGSRRVRSEFVRALSDRTRFASAGARTTAIPRPQAALTSDQRGANDGLDASTRRAAAQSNRDDRAQRDRQPAPQGLEGPRATATPHSLWFGLRVSHPSLHAGNVECGFHTQAEHGPVHCTGRRHPSVVKEPAHVSWWAARVRSLDTPRSGAVERRWSHVSLTTNPNAPIRENGVTARQRTIRSYRPVKVICESLSET